MMPITARISSRWMRPPATCSEKPSNHNTKRTTTTVQIKLTMKNLPDMMSCYLITSLSYYRRAELVSTGALVTRTRANRRLSTAGFAGMAAAGRGGKPEPVAEQQSQLEPERHRLSKVGQKGIRG